MGHNPANEEPLKAQNIKKKNNQKTHLKKLTAIVAFVCVSVCGSHWAWIV